MAMIQCPECGHAISDKAKKCIYCGKVLIEEEQPKLFCSECGKEMPLDSQECPCCGCPVEEDDIKHTGDVMDAPIPKKKRKISKIPFVIVAVCVAIAAAVGIIVNHIRSSLNEDEQLAYQNAMEMKSRMRDPDSFKLYDEMFLLKHYDENGENDYTYTIFKYGGTNGYGAVTTEEAIFKDGKYLMDYADELDYDDSDLMEKTDAKVEISWYMLGFYTEEEMKMIEIDINKIKDKMGLK